ncbi:MAG: 4'-phosphopantetheinyl transferase superfamily protein [Bacteroidales bacterium]|nr:4'-phosphopantetheinyl transferase superfamily protein [Bacteroidales bacterium]
MLVYLYTETDFLTAEFMEDCLTWYPSDQVAYVRLAKVLHDKRDRCTSYLLLLRALETWRQGERDLPLQRVDWASLQAMAQRYKSIARQGTCEVERSASSCPMPLFEYAAKGKPSIKNIPDVHFNISHCRRAVALVLHDSEVGIDVETRRNVSNALINKVCNADEQRLVRAAADPVMEFLRLWTCKESMVKYTGMGLTGHLPSILATAPFGVKQVSIPLPFIDGWLTVTHQ